MGFLLNQNGFVLGKGNERTSRSVEVSERCGKKRREASRPASTKRLSQCVCSILSISKAGPPAHSCVVVCSYLAQPYPRTSSTTVQLVYLYIAVLGALTGYEPWYLRLGSRMGAKDNIKSGGVIPFDHKEQSGEWTLFAA